MEVITSCYCELVMFTICNYVYSGPCYFCTVIKSCDNTKLLLFPLFGHYGVVYIKSNYVNNKFNQIASQGSHHMAADKLI